MAAGNASKLQDYIKLGDLKAVKKLMAPFTSSDSIREIESMFSETDPINLAINCREEHIAIYLVEKGFSVDRIYQSVSERCDQWCYSKHGDYKCPAEYDASDNAAQRKMHKLKDLIDAIRAGRRKPGDGLLETTLPQTNNRLDLMHKPEPPSQVKPQFQRIQLPKTTKEKPKSAAYEAVNLLQRYGSKFTTKDGWTLLHRSATSTPAHIYVMASNGVPVNVQNSNGDTALHLAVKADNYDTTEALLQCCADLTIRNKMGQTPADLANDDIYDLLQKCEQGAVSMVQTGKAKSLARHLPTFWTHLDCQVKDGLSLLQLGMVKVNEDENVADCCRILQDFRDSSELIHCVLAENVPRLHEILSSRRDYTVNTRFKDKYGKTLLSHAIESNNLDIVKMLVAAGARVNGVRVRENGKSAHTVPLFHKCLRKDLQPEIAHFIHSVQDASEMLEKDHKGNTALLRAVEEGATDRLIDWLLVAENGLSLTQRNESGMNARELAVSKGRSDIVQTIDKFVLQQRGKFFLVKLPVHFYGMDNLQFTDEQLGKTLLEVVEEGKDSDDIKALRHYSEIEFRGITLFQAAAKGDLADVKTHNVGNFQDKNGYTALIRAIVFQQLEVTKYLCTSRPVLKSMPDNCNRYPLHYACALPEQIGKEFIKVLLERKPEDIEKRRDKDGVFPVEYRDMRNTSKVQQMLSEARTLDAQGREGSPLAQMSDGAVDLLPVA
ncbi:serine/threonine-protein phosphatase 6 regulatory ankyrin repeat subunit A [Aplysia californica]|uniref:Serine/threonine-protein phosphatase 6 regulatory ankyrin repeat subunit A n=1 Tax=Aplysia californica TaxID=6500 RepID=A0ABM1A5D7_APLCA|nr:serine/threonine-protein phosphatase 6 regulatory ankyrin repeat subunit A [Aplysia californica]